MKHDENADIQLLWPTPMLRKKFKQHELINSKLAELFYQHMREDNLQSTPVYASSDDLLMRYNNDALNQLFSFISESVFQVASTLNGDMWKHCVSKKMNMNVVGAWFQIQNGYGFHETHNHGNCSWSGVYYVQVDDDETRMNNKELGELNGVTRFYGHHMDLIGGGYMDSGNHYMQSTSFDSKPEEGVLCIFPSHLKHTALPYIGEKDRIIISFNAQIHGEQGDELYDYSFT
ncbi:putative 2OG-Fe(II) oxygenase [Cocleimonas sp. KMM 6892]|uniref:putative 2OG-Fe(II) oxygenase n=1 Tax=unclassified Cocleimonas TaxID=2639732 RepID=UPI002DB700E9|nr:MULTISPECIES: putative 2OG-Fe(II) oxygenase [unclassified Cocleimonas]MEB8432642.1 putative 2OG-Fe(II) oxygenase [Cocleimonas sp. KMM 6892]MEC4715501.1 putative 2OG-Fe(II) oxygenase [Cocleimonas sp. KMM 6895]MEC4744881.1 putative 2OG-Fe(II) oxygenase [Cocleimonas sp. KMM 6896]